MIVGYGPVGQALAALLGRAGHRVLAFEPFQEIYSCPRCGIEIEGIGALSNTVIEEPDGYLAPGPDRGAAWAH